MFTKVLVPLDQSSLSEQAIGPAVAIAEAFGAEIDLVLAHKMIPLAGYLDASVNDATDPEQHVYLSAMIREVAARSSVTVHGAVETGSPVDVICQRARDVGADLIVMTSHGRTGITRAWLGSVADGVLRHSTVPVLMLRPEESIDSRGAVPHLFQRILIPLDGSAESAAVLDHAVTLARCANAVLILARVIAHAPLVFFEPPLTAYPVWAVDPDATRKNLELATEELDRMAKEIAAKNSLRVEVAVVVGDVAAETIVDLATSTHADLIAMTSHGRGASRLVIGSIADKVLRATRLPLLSFRPRDAGVPAARADRPGMTILI